MASLCEAAKRLCKELLFDIGGSVIANGIVDLFKKHVGTQLNEGQTMQLRRMINNAIVQYRAGREIGPIVSGIVALVAPGNNFLTQQILSNIQQGEEDSGRGHRRVEEEIPIFQFPSSSSSSSSSAARSRSTPRPVQSFDAESDGGSTLFDSWFGGAFREFPGFGPVFQAPSPPFVPRRPQHEDVSSMRGSEGRRARSRGRAREHAAPAGLAGVEFETDKGDDEWSRKLQREFHLDARVRKIPLSLRKPLYDVLSSSPVCCISMEDLVANNRVKPNTVVLFQKTGSSEGGQANHAYLFSKNSLDEWFASSGDNINPLTRANIDVRTQYFQIS